MLKNIKKTNMTQRVIEQFKQQILDGSWRVGERIPSENELAQTLGVSRSTVRQALRSLSDYGLLDIRLGSGSYVKKPESGEIMKAILPTVIFQKEDMREALDFCCIFEDGIAEMAAAKANDEDIKQLKDIQHRIETTDDFAKLDFHFHMKVAEITRNSVVIQTYTILNDLLSATMEEMYRTNGLDAGVPYHRALIEAFEEHDIEKARAIMKEHVCFRRETYLKLCNFNEK